jgi:hypothetical protein
LLQAHHALEIKKLYLKNHFISTLTKPGVLHNLALYRLSPLIWYQSNDFFKKIGYLAIADMWFWNRIVSIIIRNFPWLLVDDTTKKYLISCKLDENVKLGRMCTHVDAKSKHMCLCHSSLENLKQKLLYQSVL